MKKIFAMVAVIAATIFGVSAQDNATVAEQRMETRHEISIGIGDNLPMTLAHILSVDVPEAMIEDAFGTGCEYEDTEFTCQFNLEYGYRVAPKDVVSIALDYCSGSAKVTDKQTGKKVGSRDDSYTTLMVGYRRNWVQKPHFTFYSKVQAGVIMMHYENKRDGENTSTTDAGFMAQISPVGIEAGGKHAVFFYDLGFGQTIVQTGLRVRF